VQGGVLLKKASASGGFLGHLRGVWRALFRAESVLPPSPQKMLFEGFPASGALARRRALSVFSLEGRFVFDLRGSLFPRLQERGPERGKGPVWVGVLEGGRRHRVF